MNSNGKTKQIESKKHFFFSGIWKRKLVWNCADSVELEYLFDFVWNGNCTISGLHLNSDNKRIEQMLHDHHQIYFWSRPSQRNLYYGRFNCYLSASITFLIFKIFWTKKLYLLDVWRGIQIHLLAIFRTIISFSAKVWIANLERVCHFSCSFCFDFNLCFHDSLGIIRTATERQS